MNAPAVIDLTDPELLFDPVRGYGRLREQSPMLRATFPGVPTQFWLATRYADIRSVLSHPLFVKNPPGGGPSMIEQVIGSYGIEPDLRKYMFGMLSADGAAHARLRRLVSHAFTPRRVSGLRSTVEQLVDDLLDRLDSTADLLNDFSYPLSGTVICELIGIEEPDRARWREWANGVASRDPNRSSTAVREMVDLVRTLIARRRQHPADDLLTGLTHAPDDAGDRLTEDEMIALVVLLVQAGHDTTAHFIANATVALLDNPDQLPRLREPTAIPELLRYAAPIPAAGALHATEDVEIGGVTVRQGDAVICVLVSGNHDPRRYPDPERLDLTREPNRESHVSFGHGPHYCLGAALARIEGEVALVRLFDRYPDLELAVPPSELERHMIMPGALSFTRLPVNLRGGRAPATTPPHRPQ